MQPISSAVSDSHLRLLLQGDPKSGKSTMAAQFPNAYFIDVDLNLGGPLRRMKELGMKLPVGFDVLDKDEKGQTIEMPQRYQRFTKLMGEASMNPDISTIVIDSATTFIDVLSAETRRLQPAIKDERQFFGFFFNYGKAFMDLLKKARKHIILICHEKLEKNPDGTVLLPYRIAWPGQLGTILPAFFTDVWRCEVVEIPGVVKTYRWLVKTTPNYQYKLGNSLGLPNEFEFKWEIIEAKLKGETK